MILAMTRPHKNPKTGVYYFRQKPPADVRAAFGKAEAIRSLRTKDPVVAKLRHAEEVSKQNMVWQALRATPSPLPHKQIMALVGEYRRKLDDLLEEEPGEAGIWVNVRRLEVDHGTDADALERWGGSDADTLLREAGLAADPYSRARLIGEMHRARIDWADFQHRRASGDYSPDPSIQRFPEWTPPKATKVAQTADDSEGVTISELFELWKTRHIKAKKALSSIGDFEKKIANLRTYLGHDDARRVTGRRVDEWCDQLLAEGLSEKTVGEKYLAAVKAIFKLGVEKFRLSSNPVAANKVRVPDKVKERPAGFTETEARAILRATQGDPSSLGKRPDAIKRAIRWVPWICAYTGARVGEIAQLRREDFVVEYGVPCLRIAPEGGTVKTGNYRIVPVHSHLLELGLPTFIASQPPGPLFFTLAKADDDPVKKAANAGAKVGQWVRADVGITDLRVWPNHGWRHRFKTLCRDAGIDQESRNAIQGHGDGTAAADYGEVTIKALKRAMDAFPRIDLQV